MLNNFFHKQSGLIGYDFLKDNARAIINSLPDEYINAFYTFSAIDFL